MSNGMILTNPNSRDIIIGCVAENIPKYLSQALRLVQSIRWFGNGIADAYIIVCVVGGVDPVYAVEFKKYNADVRVVERFSDKHPPSNKLRFLQQPELTNYKHVLLLDCDTIVVQDPTPYLQGEGLRAKIADAPTVSTKLFEKIFAFSNLPMPREEYRCTVTGAPTIPYFNAGVLLFSRDAMEKLVPVWIELNEQLIKRINLLEKSSNFCEQASLSLAVAATGNQFEVFDDDMNFPTHFDRYMKSLGEIDPVIIHYHWLVDNLGFIEATPYSLANNRIWRFNERLRKEKSKHQDII